ELGRDIVGQVGDDLGARAIKHWTWIEGLRVGADDVEPAGIALGDRLKRRKRALVALHRDHAPRAEREQGARQSARARSNLDHGRILQRASGARNPRREVEIEQEILAERFACRKGVLANDLAQWRQVVDRAHAGFEAAMRAASFSAAIRLAGLALPEPAMSKAVPWSGEVRTKGRPSVTLTASSKA